MEYPSTDPRRFDGLLAHAQRYLGPVTDGEGPRFDGRNRGFGIGFHAHPELPMVSAVSTGVRFQKVAAALPQEYVVSALPHQRDEAGYLLHVVAERVVGSGSGYALGSGYVNAEVLIPGTAVELLLAWTHPYVDEDFDLYRDDLGADALQYITLIPATRAEFELIRDHGSAEPLLELWESEHTDLLDIYRPSAA